MKKYFVLFCLLSLGFHSFSQRMEINRDQQINSKRKVVYAELMGAGVIGSVNYDFRFSPGNDGLGMRIGCGYVPDVLTFPLEMNGLIGKRRIAFEYGAGISAGVFLKSVGNKESFATGIESIGYIGFAKAGLRITPKNNGLFFNFNWNPIINAEETRWIWFGLGIGYSWNK